MRTPTPSPIPRPGRPDASSAPAPGSQPLTIPGRRPPRRWRRSRAARHYPALVAGTAPLVPIAAHAAREITS